jgi:2-polyprenyl-3-methyl-5-hydroxy-6-metoxy-1,4-benzoquinol methylase
MLPDLSTRSTIHELMDNPDCDETKLLRTIQQFSSINRQVARYRTILKRWVINDMLKDPTRKYHLVDMGAGGCDIDVWLLKAARKRGLDLRISACDIDQRIIDYARSVFGHKPGLHIRKMDLLAESFHEPVDYVFANHFLHHLTSEEIIRLFQLWQPRIRRRMVISDLLRDPASYLGFSALSLFYPNSFARADGLTSIRRGFMAQEIAALADTASINGSFSIHQLHPGRVVLCVDGSADKTA